MLGGSTVGVGVWAGESLETDSWDSDSRARRRFFRGVTKSKKKDYKQCR